MIKTDLHFLSGIITYNNKIFKMFALSLTTVISKIITLSFNQMYEILYKPNTFYWFSTKQTLQGIQSYQ